MIPGTKYSPHKKFLTVMVPMALVKYNDITDGAKLAFGLLSYHGGKSGKFPKQQTLASEMGVSLDTLNRYIHELVAHGLIAVTRRGPGKPRTYAFLWTDFLSESLRDTAETPCHDTAEMPYQRAADTAILRSRHGDPAVQDTAELPCPILIPQENVLREKKETSSSSREPGSEKPTTRRKVFLSSTEATTEAQWKPEDFRHVMDALNDAGLEPKADRRVAFEVLKSMESLQDFDQWLAAGGQILGSARTWGLYIAHSKHWPETRVLADVVARKPKEDCTYCKEPLGTNQKCDYCLYAAAQRRVAITGKELAGHLNPGNRM